MYIVFLALLGIVLVVLSGIIVDKAGSMKGGDEAKKWGIGLIVLGSVMTAVSIAIIVHIHRDNIKDAAIAAGAGIKSGATGFFLNKEGPVLKGQ
jgi:drug/metabolite transporter (DMT)-like permease